MGNFLESYILGGCGSNAVTSTNGNAKWPTLHELPRSSGRQQVELADNTRREPITTALQQDPAIIGIHRKK